MADQTAQLLGLHCRIAGQKMDDARRALERLDSTERKAVIAAVKAESLRPIQRHMRTYRLALAHVLGVSNPDHPDSL